MCYLFKREIVYSYAKHITHRTKRNFFSTMAEKRKIKLQPKTRQLSYSQKTVPELRVNGNWLAESGFKPGAEVEITVKQNELIIKPL